MTRERMIHGYSASLYSERALKTAAKMLRAGTACICEDLKSYSGPWWMVRIFETPSQFVVHSDCGEACPDKTPTKLIAIGDFRKLYVQRAPLKGIKALEKQYKKVIKPRVKRKDKRK